MTFTLKMKCDNAAFREPIDDQNEREHVWAAAHETARILREVAYSLEHDSHDGKARDANGNVVGVWSLNYRR